MSREIRSLPCQLRSSSQINILMGEKCQTHTPPLTRVSNGKILQKQQFCYFVVMCFNFSNGATPGLKGPACGVKKKNIFISDLPKCL